MTSVGEVKSGRVTPLRQARGEAMMSLGEVHAGGVLEVCWRQLHLPSLC